jgi:hypothetical protein
MAWKKPFFKRVSSKISARMLNLMTLTSQGQVFYSPVYKRGTWKAFYGALSAPHEKAYPYKPPTPDPHPHPLTPIHAPPWSGEKTLIYLQFS